MISGPPKVDHPARQLAVWLCIVALTILSKVGAAESRGIALTINIDGVRMQVWGAELDDCLNRPTMDLGAKLFAINCSAPPLVVDAAPSYEVIRYGGSLGQPDAYRGIEVFAFDGSTNTRHVFADCDAIAGYETMNITVLLEQPAAGLRVPSYHFDCRPTIFRASFE